jgi:UDP-3-O-[3-hydroxymyristoyl] glucosamine N-acyltransferase
MFNLKIKFKMENKVQVSNSAQIAQNCLLGAVAVD